MISLIGLFLFIIGFLIMNIFGTKYSFVQNTGDKIGISLIVASFVCMMYSIAILFLKYLP